MHYRFPGSGSFGRILINSEEIFIFSVRPWKVVKKIAEGCKQINYKLIILCKIINNHFVQTCNRIIGNQDSVPDDADTSSSHKKGPE
jgi:hypothetical protein